MDEPRSEIKSLSAVSFCTKVIDFYLLQASLGLKSNASVLNCLIM